MRDVIERAWDGARRSWVTGLAGRDNSRSLDFARDDTIEEVRDRTREQGFRKASPCFKANRGVDTFEE